LHTPNHEDKIKPVHEKIENYMMSLHRLQDEPVLLEMEELAKKNNFPIIGRLVGAFLEVMALSIGAKRIFEFGSGYGYSAYWFSRAVGPDGKVICTDGNPDNAKLANEYMQRINRQQQIEFHVGWAQDTFKTMKGDFDIIYCDVDKDAYPEVWQLAKDRLRPGGLYIADNTLWSGRVAMQTITNDVAPGWTEAIKEHNKMISEDKSYDFFLNPTRDGVIIARKK